MSLHIQSLCSAVLINKTNFISVLQPRLRCDKCDGNIHIEFGPRGNINIICNSSQCRSKYNWITQERIKIVGTKQRGVPAQIYLTAVISILAGSTHDAYEQNVKSHGLEALSAHTYYDLCGTEVYESTVKVWNESKHKVYPHAAEISRIMWIR